MGANGVRTGCSMSIAEPLADGGGYSVHMIHGRREYRYLSRVWHELTGLFVLWLFWLVGAAVATVRKFADIIEDY